MMKWFWLDVGLAVLNAGIAVWQVVSGKALLAAIKAFCAGFIVAIAMVTFLDERERKEE